MPHTSARVIAVFGMTTQHVHAEMWYSGVPGGRLSTPSAECGVVRGDSHRSVADRAVGAAKSTTDMPHAPIQSNGTASGQSKAPMQYQQSL